MTDQQGSLLESGVKKAACINQVWSVLTEVVGLQFVTDCLFHFLDQGTITRWDMKEVIYNVAKKGSDSRDSDTLLPWKGISEDQEQPKNGSTCL